MTGTKARLEKLEQEIDGLVNVTKYLKLVYEMAGDVYSGPEVGAPKSWVLQNYRDCKRAYEKWQRESQSAKLE